MKIQINSQLCVLCTAFQLGLLLHPLFAQESSQFFPGSNNETYTDWLNSVTYNKSTFIESTSDTGNGVAVHWTIDDRTIHLAVAAQATGWVGFGFAESGSMLGADIVMYTAATDTLTDSFVLDQPVKPIADDCQSWELVNSVVDGGFIIFEAKRPVNTNDTQDRNLIDDSFSIIPSTRVIAAWGNTSEPLFHGNSVARGSIRFYGASDAIDEKILFVQTMAVESEGNFTISAKNFTIPSDADTTYQLFCYSRDELVDLGVPIDQDLHTIGFEPIVQTENAKYIHHFILYASSLPWNNKSLACDYENRLLIENAYTWAPGDFPLALPSNVGGPLGSAGFQSFTLEIHYNNADLDVNVTDSSSGVRVYYTSEKREYDLGIFQMGDPYVGLGGSLVNPLGGLAQHSFTCGEQCSGQYLNETVTVLREHLHMHMTGVSMVNYHIRNEQVIRMGKVEFWDFDQQGDFAVVQAPFQMNPGDSFRTVCKYDSTNDVSWGIASEQEMCIAFLYYYPRKLISDEIPIICGLGVGDFLPGCEVTYSNSTQDFMMYDQLERSFGTAPSSCPNIMSAPISSPAQSPVQPDSTSSSYSIHLTVFTSILYVIAWTSQVIPF
jgi:Copper type II ascorbate-dependent monooxygenase, N-terminal domain/Copper type II ascorbate-dependent monooxygenase, C-terminal domain/DOMON domain